MKHIINCSSLADIDRTAEAFLKELGSERRIIAFHAPMGAGKTTFITAICKVLGVREDSVSSPTFAIVNEYKTANRDSIFHFDFYRIENLGEALDIGFYDYIDSGSLCLIEWPENIAPLLPEETVTVTIEVLPDLSRKISWES